MTNKTLRTRFLKVFSTAMTTVLLLFFSFSDMAFSEDAQDAAGSTPAYVLPVRIGVLLPLSGKYAAFGEQALRGILLAADVFEAGSHPEGISIELVIRDTKDDPAAAAKAVAEIVSSQWVSGIIGPLLSVTAMEAANKAQEYKVPIITVSQREDVTNAGEYVFRNFLSPSEQAAAIADYAVNELNYTKLAVIYPGSHYGNELANLFKEEIKKNDVEIVAEEQYKEGQTDFGKEIVKLFRIRETEKKEGRRSVRIFESDVEVDALYIPDYFDRVGLIAPHLAYYNIKDITLLGSNAWNSPRLVEMAGKYIEGAIFTDGFFAGSRRPATKEFVGRFRKMYDVDPAIIEAQAYDAAKMMIKAAHDGKGIKERMRESLALIKDFQGATGDINFNENRQASKPVFILTVKNGKIVEVQ